MAKKAVSPTKSKAAARDQRRHARVPLKARVDFELFSDDTFLFEYTTNVSRGGIFLSTRNPLPVGTRLNLRFSLPGEPGLNIETTGKVVWINKYRPEGPNLNPGMGVEFINLSDEDREAISNLVRRKALLIEE